MSSFSPSGFYGFPQLTPDALDRKDSRYDAALIGWLDEAIQEGDSINEGDPNYDKIASGMAYVSGEQRGPLDAKDPPYIQPLIINLCRKAMQAHVSALTDVKAVFGWRSQNPKYQMAAHQMNLLAIAWWLNNMADVSFGDVVKYAWAAGTGDMMIEWDGTLPGGGDHRVIPKDCRDTLPIRPSRYGGVQSWQGVIFREGWSVNALRETYPMHARRIDASSDSLLSQIKGLFVRKSAQFQTPADPLANLGSTPRAALRPRQGDVTLFRCYLTDRSRNLTGKPIVIGEPGKSYSYLVEPGDLLYPNKRLIVRTDQVILYDGPNPYWHGKYPFARFMPWKLPWMFLGQPALADLKPMQDSVNRLGRHVLSGIEQWMDQQVRIDTSAVGEAAAKMYDSRKPGMKIKLRSGAVDPAKAFEKVDGPNPQVLAMASASLEQFIARFDSLAGTGNLESLLTLKQLPAENTLEKFYQAMTPELRLEGRMFEAFLRDVSPQIMYNTLQFMDSPRRVHLLGDAGLALEDFDMDPDTLVPSHSPTIQVAVGPMGVPIEQANPDYDPQFDAGLSRAERARNLGKLLTFMVAPNSVLAVNAQEEKMMDFQLARMGYLDFWSLMERLERPNVGTPPPMPLPVLRPPKDETALLQGLLTGQYQINPQVLAGMLGGPGGLMGGAQAASGGGASDGALGGGPPSADGTEDPTGAPPSTPGGPAGGGGLLALLPQLLQVPGALLEMRAPITITERLMAQQLLGIGMTENPAGRKASGQESPKVEEKDGGSRTTVTESQK